MIVVELYGKYSMLPENKDFPYFKELEKKIQRNKKRTFKYLKNAYIKYRNIDNDISLSEIEKAYIIETMERQETLNRKINMVCATATIRGALINDMVINKNVTLEEYSNRSNGITFYQSNC